MSMWAHVPLTLVGPGCRMNMTLGTVFMCMSLDAENMESMASTFLVNNAKVGQRGSLNERMQNCG